MPKCIAPHHPTACPIAPCSHPAPFSAAQTPCWATGSTQPSDCCPGCKLQAAVNPLIWVAPKSLAPVMSGLNTPAAMCDHAQHGTSKRDVCRLHQHTDIHAASLLHTGRQHVIQDLFRTDSSNSRLIPTPMEAICRPQPGPLHAETLACLMVRWCLGTGLVTHTHTPHMLGTYPTY